MCKNVLSLHFFFHSKRAIFMVQKRQHFVIFQLFNVKMSFRLKEDEKYVEISPLKQKKSWILNFQGDGSHCDTYIIFLISFSCLCINLEKQLFSLIITKQPILTFEIVGIDTYFHQNFSTFSFT